MKILSGHYEGVEILANETEFILMWNPPKDNLPIKIKTEHLITMLRALELL